jgi:N-acetylneuraminate synthase
VAAKDIPKGKIISKEDLTFKRPAHGISPKYIDDVVGKEANVDIMEDEIIIKNMI